MKKYKCIVHGHIEEDTLNITLDDIEHVYCIRCLDEALLENFVQVNLVEDDDES